MSNWNYITLPSITLNYFFPKKLTKKFKFVTKTSKFLSVFCQNSKFLGIFRQNSDIISYFFADIPKFLAIFRLLSITSEFQTFWKVIKLQISITQKFLSNWNLSNWKLLFWKVIELHLSNCNCNWSLKKSNLSMPDMNNGWDGIKFRTLKVDRFDLMLFFSLKPIQKRILLHGTFRRDQKDTKWTNFVDLLFIGCSR